MALKTETIYQVTNYRGQSSYCFTPDGEGCVWYDSLAEVREDTGLEGTVVALSEHDFFKMRGHL